MFWLIGLALSTAAAIIGFVQARAFVGNRLRYVDAAQAPIAPVIAGVGAGLLALPVVALLPLVSAGTAIGFGISVGLGVSAGAKDIRKRLGA